MSSRRARLFSEFLDESIMSAPTVSSVSQDAFAKRRKTSGLNSRFDRMVETMNITHRSPVKSARNRAGSTSSASASSVPRTPIDDYDEYHREGRLGPDFSVIKMGASSIPRNKWPKRRHAGAVPWDQDSSSDITEPPPPPVPLPAWLASTFSTLAPKNPLRLLLPRRTESEPTSPPEPAQISEDDSPFSFCAPADPTPESSPHTAEDDAEPSTQSTQTPSCPPPAETAFVYRPSSLPDSSFGAIPPFSTPGPGSVVSRSIVSDTMPSVHLSGPPRVEYAPARICVPPVCSPEPTFFNCTAAFAPPLNSTPVTKHTASPSTAQFYHGHSEYTNSAYIDIFATPAPKPVYFDSPTEEPSDSDPLEPGYELDSLDFRWEPFIQKGVDENDRTPPMLSAVPPAPARISNSDDHYYEIQVDPEGEDDENGQLYASIHIASTERCASPGPFSFAPPDDFSTTRRETSTQIQETPVTPERPVPLFFAPAPGIFISPLRNNDSSPKESAQLGHGSQSSNDPIEEWEDDTMD
ncbi:hypothetical protein C8R44DRAFT_889652 [Mycena epipterygia]|nr:hypothetical protein C8R44DRAFT_889652 [Mycena epipterygia]